MDYSQWSQPQPPQPADPNQSAVDYASYYPYCVSLSNQPQNPNPNPVSHHQTHESAAITATYADLAPPPPRGIESYVSVGSYPDASAASYQTVDTASCYNSDPNAQNWAWKEAIRLYGADPNAYTGTGTMVPPNGTEQLALTYQSSSWPNHSVQVQRYGNGPWKKHLKKTKLIQSAYCEVCKVDCNSTNVLEQHKLGKKHQKNLEKLQASLSSSSNSSEAGSSVPIIGPQENPSKNKAASSRKNVKKAAETVEDLETKRRKVVEGGEAAQSVKTCVICNVVCNSEKVFSDHLAGQKHGVMVKKHKSQAGVASVT